MTDSKRYGLDQLRKTGGRGTVDVPMLSGWNLGSNTPQRDHEYGHLSPGGARGQ